MIIKLFLDVRVITLEKDVTLNKKVQIAKLPNENEECDKYGKNMVISGWEVTWSKGENSTEHRFADVPMYLEHQCLNVSRCPLLTESNPMICVGDLEDDHNSACAKVRGGKILL